MDDLFHLSGGLMAGVGVVHHHSHLGTVHMGYLSGNGLAVVCPFAGRRASYPLPGDLLSAFVPRSRPDVFILLAEFQSPFCGRVSSCI